MAEPIISLVDVNFSYDGKPVLEGVNLQVEEREALYVVGPNAGGKTTLLMLILGLLEPQSGEISVFGNTPGAMTRKIGYVPQLLMFDKEFPVSVREIVLMGRLGHNLRGRYSASDRIAADKALDEMEMLENADTPFAKLSGGQRQRVMIARALCDNPELILLDEPTSNIDAKSGARLFEYLAELNKRMAILLVSHDLGLVPNIFKRVVMVNRTVKAVKTCNMSGDLVQEIYGEDHRIIHHHG